MRWKGRKQKVSNSKGAPRSVPVTLADLPKTIKGKIEPMLAQTDDVYDGKPIDAFHNMARQFALGWFKSDRIDENQLAACNKFMDIWEQKDVGVVRGIDTTREYVDTSTRAFEPISGLGWEARNEIRRVQRAFDASENLGSTAFGEAVYFIIEGAEVRDWPRLLRIIDKMVELWGMKTGR